MVTHWSTITLNHVEQACAQFDAGTALPSHPARNTFLLLNGKRYPAKFIRGLAYKLATGSNPSDYQGGAETIAFFTRLGLKTEYKPSGHTTPTALTNPSTLECVAADGEDGDDDDLDESSKPAGTQMVQKTALTGDCDEQATKEREREAVEKYLRMNSNR